MSFKNRFFAAALAAVFSLASFTPLSAAPSATKTDKPQRLSQGTEIAIADLVVPGKTTVFDFTSDYCPPCREIAPMLDKLHASQADIVVVKIDINRPDVKGIDWKSPVARQYELNSIPHFKVYGPDGKLQAEGQAATQIVLKLLDNA